MKHHLATKPIAHEFHALRIVLKVEFQGLRKIDLKLHTKPKIKRQIYRRDVDREAARLLKARKRLHTIRVWVVKTAVPPFSLLYLLFYHLCIKIIVWRESRIPGTHALYLRRGFARGEVIPGISDADIGYVGEPHSLHTAWVTHRKWAQYLPVIDFANDGFSPQTMEEIYAHQPLYHYRFYEGFLTWKLLWGTDIIRKLPPPLPTVLPWGIYSELGIWWSFMTEKAIQEPQSRWEEIEKTALCYKSLAETFKLFRFLKTDHYLPRRKETLKLKDGIFGEEGEAFAERAIAHEKTRFLKHDPAFPEDTLHYLFRCHEGLQTELVKLPMMQPKRNLTLRVDGSLEEWALSVEERSEIAGLAERLRRDWEGVQGAALTPCLLFEVEEPVLTLFMRPNCLPTRKQISALFEEAAEWKAQRPRGFYIYLALEQNAYALFASVWETQRGARSLLNPAVAPDYSLLLERPEFMLFGEAHPTPFAPRWTERNEQYLLHWRMNPHVLNLLQLWEPQALQFEAWDFLVRWWKVVQLNLLARSVHRGEAVFPVTLPALLRGLEREGVPLPQSLALLHTGYGEAMRGESVNINPIRPPAIEFLRALDEDTQARFPFL